ncbi:vWA domain-containing protein [Aliterella atlantica]|uniref:von Willebrand factor type A n=1 Tax=Aliterella atlantica CENA595 TaxID=1618023 RepID=A0A0D8ZXN4_9CYAN|nr:VWA domain-containing protein [Aliterella atlantica]KJH71976.1 von Willebrand factor type A [Aliterella atlantica CENA595]
MPEFLRLEDAVEFAENPEPRCPCVLLLDISGSMQGEAINALNEGLKVFKEELNRDNLAKKRVEVAIVTFNSNVDIVQDFVTADQFEPPTLSAQGLTVMGTAIHRGLDMVSSRKAQYSASGVAYYRPWVFLITDGEPQGEPESVVEQAMQRIRDDEANKRVAFFAVGVEGANMERLSQIVVRSPLKLVGLNFQEMFIWLSASMQRVSQSKMDEQIPLPPPGWGIV